MTTSATVGVLQMSQMFHPARWYLSATWSVVPPLPWSLSRTEDARFIIAITETSVRSGTTAPGKSSRLQVESASTLQFVSKFGRCHRATYWSNQDLAGWGRGQLPA